MAKLVEVFREVRRVLRADGVLWLNLGDSYASSGVHGGHGKTAIVGNTKSDCQGRAPTPLGLKPKDLIGIPWRVAFALQADGWYLRSDIIWAKPNPMPESVTDRCTKSHEYIFMFTKSARYFYDAEAVKEPASPLSTPSAGNRGAAPSSRATPSRPQKLGGGSRGCNGGTRNRRDVWTISTKPYRAAHFAVFPPEIPEICIKAGTSERGCCPICGAPWVRVVERGASTGTDGKEDNSIFTLRNDALRHSGRVGETKFLTIGFRPSCDCGADTVPCTVLDPFAGSGTTGAVAKSLGRDYILIEANPDYIELIEARLAAADRPPATLEGFE